MPEPETFPGSLVPLLHPDPDVDAIPMLTADDALALQTETAGHLVRAITRLDDVIAAQTKRMEADVQAWGYEIGKLQARRENWRVMILSWMERTGTTQIKSPWFTASRVPAKPKILVDDEAACIALCKIKEAKEAYKSKESLVKKEFDILFNSLPKLFMEVKDEKGELVRPQIAHEDKGEPTLRILKKNV